MAEDSKRLGILKDSLNALRTAVESLSAALANLNTLFSQLSGKAISFAKEVNKAADSINNVGKNTNDATKSAKGYSKSVEDTEKSVKKLGTSSSNLAKQQENLNVEFDNSAKSSKRATINIGDFFKNLGKNIRTVLSFYAAFTVLNLAFRAISELTVGAARRAIDFEAALKDVQAVAGLTAEDLGRLRDTTFEVAGATKLTLIETVELQKQLAKLGASVDEIEQLSKPVAVLAQALGEEPGGVAAALQKTLNQFQATTAEANRFANVFTGAVNETALSINDLGTGLQYVGPLASQLGISVEETSAFLGILADNGFKASRAGTGLRQFFIAAAKDGRPFNDFLEDLAANNLTLTEAVEEFNKTGASQAIVIVENIKRFRELSDELTDQTRLLKANAIQMSSFQGQLDLLNTAYDKVSTSIGSLILDSDFLIGIIQALDSETAGTAKSFRVLANESDAVTVAIDGATEALRRFREGQDDGVDDVDALTNALKALRASGEFDELNVVEKIVGETDPIEEAERRIQSLIDQGYTLEEIIGNDEIANSFKKLAIEVGMLDGLKIFGGGDQIDLAYQSLLKVLEETRNAAEILDNQFISQQAVNESVEEYRQRLLDLQRDAAAGNDITTDQLELEEDLSESRNQASIELDSLNAQNRLAYLQGEDQTEQQKQQIANRNEEIAILRERIKIIDQITNQSRKVEVDEEEAEKRRKAARDKAIREERNRLRDQIKDLNRFAQERIDAINEQAAQDTAAAENAFERAEIEAKRQKDVSDVYKLKSRELKGLNVVYAENSDLVEDATYKADKFAEVLGSEVISDLERASNEYKGEIRQLKEDLEDGIISKEKYNESVTSLRDGLEANIDTFRTMFGTNEELEEFFANLLYGFEQAADAEELWAKKNEESEDKFIKLGDNLRAIVDVSFGEVLGDALSTATDAISNFNDTALENTEARIERELDAIENRYSVEEDILKAQLDNQLISESQFRQKQEALRKKQIKEEDKLEKQLFEAEKKRDRQQAGTDYLQAIASIIPTLLVKGETADPVTLSIKAAISAALATAAYGSELAAINQRKYVAKFEDGGFVHGPSHSEGGVPFTVQGQGGYEMEGGEFIVNKRAASLHRDLLERINGSYKMNTSYSDLRFANGGLVPDGKNITEQIQTADESVNYLKAIADATISTAINSNKPVRAFVTSSDLNKDETARRIKQNNTTI
jgi:hypothetical protein